MILLVIEDFFRDLEAIKKDSFKTSYAPQEFYSGYCSTKRFLYDEVKFIAAEHSLRICLKAEGDYKPASTCKFKLAGEYFEKHRIIHSDFSNCLSLVVFVSGNFEGEGISFFENMDEESVFHTVGFKENRAVLFDSKILHRSGPLFKNRTIFTAFLKKNFPES